MAKRGYKLQEFVAHSGNVNCLRFGKKNCRVFITGGDDQKVNIWSVGKPTSLMSLCGHTSPVESATFDSAEVLVVAGSSSGAIKLWDLEETKMVRTLSGHRSYCTAVEFHPFGEFFASGSMDTNLKIWDIRKKGCIHTYKGHTRGISTIRFTPDGRWVVSGGFDNVVKVWDLTAGKLLHDFKFHEGHVRSIEFHPLEFLLATGSADKTVKFWDLETFEMIGSARRESTGVRSLTFHPDGKTLFCGLDDSLKVYSWEPIISHDSVDMGWSTLGDLCIHDGKLLGGAYYENSVAVWVADISLIEPYGSRLSHDQPTQLDQKCGIQQEKEDNLVKFKSNRRSTTPDSDSKETKTIYVDRVNSVFSKTTSLPEETKSVLSSVSKESDTDAIKKRPQTVNLPVKSNVPSGNRSLIIPSIVPRDGPDGKDSVGSRRESIGGAKSSRVASSKPPNSQRLINGRFDMERLSMSLDCVPCDNVKSNTEANIHARLVTDESAKESSESKQSSLKTAVEKFDRTSSQSIPASTGVRTPNSSKMTNPIKVVNGVAVVHGRTRSLVERFEKRENSEVDDVCTLSGTSVATIEATEASSSQKFVSGVTSDVVVIPSSQTFRSGVTALAMEAPSSQKSTMAVETPSSQVEFPPSSQTLKSGVTSTIAETPASQTFRSGRNSANVDCRVSQNSDLRIVSMEEPMVIDNKVIENLMNNHDSLLSMFRSRLTKLQVVRHFWERNDFKGAINAVTKLPDYSVQADIVGVFIEKIEIITLDLFSCLLPVLVGLLESKVERHASVSLDMLLKLVSIFGTIIHSTISAPPLVGVDLHAEERIKCCKRCFAHLQNIQKTIPTLVMRGGVVARCAQQLNLVLQH